MDVLDSVRRSIFHLGCCRQVIPSIDANHGHIELWRRNPNGIVGSTEEGNFGCSDCAVVKLGQMEKFEVEEKLCAHS